MSSTVEQSIIRELMRCDRELTRVTGELAQGNPDVDGCQLGVHDWSREQRILFDILDSPELRVKSYKEYLLEKSPFDAGAGHESNGTHEHLYEFQRDITNWALRRGRAAIFAECGLGKTPMQLTWAECVAKKTGKPVIIFGPAAVPDQTVDDGVKFGIEVTEIGGDEEVWHGPFIYICNYQKLHLFEHPEWFGGIVLDESSILKSMDGHYRKALTEFAQVIPYRLCCTATPSPNDITEITNHAEFLGIMTVKEVMSMFFINKQGQSKKDGGKGNERLGWQLKVNAADDFWSWLASWSVWIRKPSDLGYSDVGYDLPPLNVEYVYVEDGEGEKVETGGIQGRLEDRRMSIDTRIVKANEIGNGDEEQWITWCGLNAESTALTNGIRGTVEVKGGEKPRVQKSKFVGFKDGTSRVMVSKPRIAGLGLNWQHCHNMAFVGLSDSYEEMYQAIRRCWRFGQTKPVNVKIIVAKSQENVVENLKRKEAQAMRTAEELVKRTSVYSVENCKRQSIEYEEPKVESGDTWALYQGDCIELIDTIAEENSIGLSVFSPPFPSMYVYSNSPRDVGNVKGVMDLIDHFGYLMRPLLKVTMPGRSCCIHLTQAVAFKGVDGYTGIKDFRGPVIAAMEASGWIYYGEVCIDKNPQVKAIRTKDAGLLFKSLATDSARMHMCLADYMLQFKKPGENTEPILAGTHEKYNPNGGWITQAEWIEWAAPVWYRQTKGKPDGIKETDTLRTKTAKSDQEEKHLCPLQLGVIERCIKLWSNPGDWVFDPFSGIGSVGYKCIEYKRNFIGTELKESYFDVAAKNIRIGEGLPRCEQCGSYVTDVKKHRCSRAEVVKEVGTIEGEVAE